MAEAKGFIAEFKAFISKGNVLDMAVGIIIGIAFGAVISSAVNDMIMPPVGLGLGGVDFKEQYILLKDGTEGPPYASLDNATKDGAVTLRYGNFCNTVINFLIISFIVFLIVKIVATMKKKEEAKPPTTRACPHCDSQISRKATRCPNCTSEVEPVKEEKKPEPKPAKKGKADEEE